MYAININNVKIKSRDHARYSRLLVWGGVCRTDDIMR